mgnify:CR=1 FL=1
MKLSEIDTNMRIPPLAGRYIFHEPTQKIVLCGKVDREKNEVVYMLGSSVRKDSIENFRLIKLSEKEKRDRIANRGCRSCGK